jgi:hypothetical protein
MCSRVGDGEQFHVRGAEQTKIDRDVGLRRNERRRMRAKLKVFTPRPRQPPPQLPHPISGSRAAPPMLLLFPSNSCRMAPCTPALDFNVEVGSRWQHVWVKMNAMKIDH